MFSVQAHEKCTTQTWSRTAPWLLPPFRSITPAHPTAIPFLVCSFHLFSYTKLCSASEKFFFSRCIQTDKNQNTSKSQINRGISPSFFLGTEVFQALNHWHWSDSYNKNFGKWNIDSTKGQIPSKTYLSRTPCVTSPTSYSPQKKMHCLILHCTNSPKS